MALCVCQGVCIFEYSEMSQQRAMRSALEHRKVGGVKLRVTTAEEAIEEGRFPAVMQKASASSLQYELGLSSSLLIH